MLVCYQFPNNGGAYWRLAILCPILKKGDLAGVFKYHPVSLTSIIFKIFKRFLNKAPQHGPLPRWSCFSNRLVFEEAVKRVMDEDHTVIGLVFARAFDSVNQ